MNQHDYDDWHENRVKRLSEENEALRKELKSLKASLGEPVGTVIEYHVDGMEYGRNGAIVRDAELLDVNLPIGTKLYALKDGK